MKLQSTNSFIVKEIDSNHRFQIEYDQRETQFAIKALMAINGGGAIALLAFLGQIWVMSDN